MDFIPPSSCGIAEMDQHFSWAVYESVDEVNKYFHLAFAVNSESMRRGISIDRFDIVRNECAARQSIHLHAPRSASRALHNGSWRYASRRAALHMRGARRPTDVDVERAARAALKGLFQSPAA